MLPASDWLLKLKQCYKHETLSLRVLLNNTSVKSKLNHAIFKNSSPKSKNNIDFSHEIVTRLVSCGGIVGTTPRISKTSAEPDAGLCMVRQDRFEC